MSLFFTQIKIEDKTARTIKKLVAAGDINMKNADSGRKYVWIFFILILAKNILRIIFRKNY